ncbi:MAG: hypothetical protein O6944_01080, partial [Gammaproteobacteria bacterium]|nr:hypothetical protein [Gammaproteobacteria bacterium]
MVSFRSIAKYVVNPRRLADRWRIHCDLRQFRQAYASLFGVPVRSDADPRVLVVGLHDFIPSAKEDGVYAKTLEWRGYTPYILVERNSITLQYYKVFGFNRFIAFSDFIHIVPRDPFLDRAREVVSGADRAADLVNLRYRDVYVGRHVLSLLTRQ